MRVCAVAVILAASSAAGVVEGGDAEAVKMSSARNAMWSRMSESGSVKAFAGEFKVGQQQER